MSEIRFTVSAEMDHKTGFKEASKPGEVAVLMYLHLRKIEGGGPATREAILTDTELSERTVDGALARLKRAGKIERIVTYLARDFEFTP